MKITEYPEIVSLSDGDVVLVDGPTGTHTFQAKKLGTQAINENWNNIWTKIYPVGSLYLSFNSVSPAVLFGGSWTQISGRFLRAATDTGTGGADTVTLTAAQSGMPAHSHGARFKDAAGSGDAAFPDPIGVKTNKFVNGYIQSTSAVNAGSAHTNMPAYQDVYVWRRTA